MFGIPTEVSDDQNGPLGAANPMLLVHGQLRCACRFARLESCMSLAGQGSIFLTYKSKEGGGGGG